jgi:predicted kinase
MIVDATFKDPEHRRLFLESAQRMGDPALFVECQLRKQAVSRRITL